MKIFVRVLNLEYVTGAEKQDVIWSDTQDERFNQDDFCTLELDLPVSLCRKLLVHGPSNQVFSDGYEAWDEINNYLKTR